MQSRLASSGGTVEYALPLDDALLPLNPLLGKSLTLRHSGDIHCSHCGKKTNKSYSQGFCFPCMKKLPQCDLCIMKPETCHHSSVVASERCRDESWGEANCMVDHYVYLSNTSAVKVGITRHSQLPTRWIDQGANQGLPIFKVSTRYQSGLIETAMAQLISDKTNWRTMLKGDAEPLQLADIAQQLIPQIDQALDNVRLQFGEQSVQQLNHEVTEIQYPVLQYPGKISSLNFDKTPELGGTLLGIKGQYLIFDSGVINMRKFSSYLIEAEY
ncbi:DUF2797 domain-containing protein [Paraferrimonas haliotis]|nr:DUF2797 domain-containing protein [Paraferrimonas haliotis]